MRIGGHPPHEWALRAMAVACAIPAVLLIAVMFVGLLLHVTGVEMPRGLASTIGGALNAVAHVARSSWVSWTWAGMATSVAIVGFVGGRLWVAFAGVGGLLALGVVKTLFGCLC